MASLTRLALLILLITTTQMCFASDDNWQETCKSESVLAKTIMTGRQRGVDMSKSMELAQNVKDPGLAKAVTLLVIEAYKKPRFQTDEMQEREETDFGNEMYLACAQAATK